MTDEPASGISSPFKKPSKKSTRQSHLTAISNHFDTASEQSITTIGSAPVGLHVNFGRPGPKEEDILVDYED